MLVNDTLAGLYTLAHNSKFFKALVAVAIEAGELKVTATTPKGAAKWGCVGTRTASAGRVMGRYGADGREGTPENG